MRCVFVVKLMTRIFVFCGFMAKVVGWGFMNGNRTGKSWENEKHGRMSLFPSDKNSYWIEYSFHQSIHLLTHLMNLVKFEDCKIENIPVKWGTTSPVWFFIFKTLITLIVFFQHNYCLFSVLSEMWRLNFRLTTNGLRND